MWTSVSCVKWASRLRRSELFALVLCFFLLMAVPSVLVDNWTTTVVHGQTDVGNRLGHTTVRQQIPLLPERLLLRSIWTIPDWDKETSHSRQPIPNDTHIQLPDVVTSLENTKHLSEDGTKSDKELSLTDRLDLTSSPLPLTSSTPSSLPSSSSTSSPHLSQNSTTTAPFLSPFIIDPTENSANTQRLAQNGDNVNLVVTSDSVVTDAQVQQVNTIHWEPKTDKLQHQQQQGEKLQQEQKPELQQQQLEKQQQQQELQQRGDGKVRTFAVVWPCLGQQTSSCFLHSHYPLERCHYRRCEQTWDLEQADVVVFYAFRIKNETAHIPQFTRPPGQRWVMMTPEPAIRVDRFAVLDFPRLKGQFNWTLTYRVDSDIPQLYGQLERIVPPVKNYSEIISRKSVVAAWFVSHCDTDSKRSEYVQRMQQEAEIHVYGACGNYSCRDKSKRDLDDKVCMPLLSRTYFFYLAFENAMCKDYVTEKLFKIFSNVDVVPVVRGWTDYKRYFPPNIFVDASDFSSPEDLSRFLIQLAKDKTRYLEMLQEKNKYVARWSDPWQCNLCKKMMTDTSEKWYSDLRRWFVKDQCYRPNRL